jgi:hypothetical protein
MVMTVSCLELRLTAVGIGGLARGAGGRTPLARVVVPLAGASRAVWRQPASSRG